MKKYLILAIICFFSISSFAQEEKSDLTISASTELSPLQIAAGLVKYGYANYSATNLAGAAILFSETKTQQLDVKVERGQSDQVDIKDNEVSYLPL